MTEKKIVFLDVDGTLINYSAVMPESAGKAIDIARSKGHKVYICTGCSKAEILKRNLCQLDGMIGANGGYVEDSGKVIMHQSLPKETVKEIVDWCKQRGCGLYLESNAGQFCDDKYLEVGEEIITKYIMGKGKSHSDAAIQARGLMKNWIHLNDDELIRDDINKISYVLTSYQDFLDSKVRFHDLIANTWGGKGELALFGDLSPEGITKKKGIETLVNYLGLSMEDTISFGDAKIDLSMFECCKYNVAMGNGGAEIKAAADYVTSDVDDDGLYKAFEYLGLLK